MNGAEKLGPQLDGMFKDTEGRLDDRIGSYKEVIPDIENLSKPANDPFKDMFEYKQVPSNDGKTSYRVERKTVIPEEKVSVLVIPKIPSENKLGRNTLMNGEDYLKTIGNEIVSNADQNNHGKERKPSRFLGRLAKAFPPAAIILTLALGGCSDGNIPNVTYLTPSPGISAEASVTNDPTAIKTTNPETDPPAQTTAGATEKPTPERTVDPTAETTPSPIESSEVTPNQSPEATKIPYFIMGGMPEFSAEKNNEWREISKKNIIDFVQNGPDESKLLPLNSDSKIIELGAMSNEEGSEFKAMNCQFYLLGGETRNGCWCLYFGTQDVNKNWIVIPAQEIGTFGGIQTISFSGDNFIEALSNQLDPTYLTDTNVNTLDSLLKNYQNSAIFPNITYNYNEPFEPFYQRMGMFFNNDEDFTRKYYLDLKETVDVGYNILLQTNLVDPSLSDGFDSNLDGNSIDTNDLPIINSNNLGQINNLFDKYDPRTFLTINAIRYLE